MMMAMLCYDEHTDGITLMVLACTVVLLRLAADDASYSMHDNVVVDNVQDGQRSGF